MKTIWVIEKGSDSDYWVVGVFSTKENAQVVCDRINKDESYERATIDEWPMNPGVEAINQGHEVYLVWMLRDRTVEKVQCKSEGCDFQWALQWALNDKLTVWRRSEAPAHQGKNVQDCLYGRVFAKDEQHTIKIVNERRTQMIAQGQW